MFLTGDLGAARGHLEQAIEIAGQQDARLFRPRSLVCSVLDEPRRGRVIRDALQPLYAWFAECADTADLRDARTLPRPHRAVTAVRPRSPPRLAGPARRE